MKYIMLLAAGFAALVISGCASTGQKIQTPAQVASQVCPAATAAITSLQQVNGLSVSAQADLAKAAPVVAAVCAAGTTVNALDLKSLSATALPAILSVVNASPLADDVKTRIGIDLTVAQIVLASVISSLPADASGVATQ